MKIQFYKYQGTGNDFIMVDNRHDTFPKNNTKIISSFCDRRFGIGADGLILLENDNSADFRMIYYNSDGKEGSMCGNGGRCLVAFAQYLGLIGDTATFRAVDGLHTATIEGDMISLGMKDVSQIVAKRNHLFLNTGSPHHVQLVPDLSKFNVPKEGAKIRYGLYGENGSNVNFVEQTAPNSFAVRTYERGVEDETLSCGTGVTAVALAMYHSGKAKKMPITIQSRGGDLSVQFETTETGFKNIVLRGSVKQVFKGEITC